MATRLKKSPACLIRKKEKSGDCVGCLSQGRKKLRVGLGERRRARVLVRSILLIFFFERRGTAGRKKSSKGVQTDIRGTTSARSEKKKKREEQEKKGFRIDDPGWGKFFFGKS